jgi:hypothetical protein
MCFQVTAFNGTMDEETALALFPESLGELHSKLLAFEKQVCSYLKTPHAWQYSSCFFIVLRSSICSV